VTDDRTGDAWNRSPDADVPEAVPDGDVPAAAADDDGEAEVEALASAIERTRDDMSQTVEAIGGRLDPATIVEDAKETVRAATVGKVEQMAGNAAETANEMFSEARQTAEDTGAGILETVRRNPIPVAMAGIGIGWLVMNRSSGQTSRRWVDQRDQWQRYDRYGVPNVSAGDRAWAGSAELSGRPAGIADQASGAVDRVGRQAGDLADDVGATAGRMVDQARTTMDRVPDEFGGTIRDAQSTAQRIVEDNPLAVGAIAVAVGAAIGMALPETQTEREVLGPAAERAVTTVERAATDAVQQLESSPA
jgi:ElaB/YqjD/DUF883 family membrane-anchored ribosome-binding protein